MRLEAAVQRVLLSVELEQAVVRRATE